MDCRRDPQWSQVLAEVLLKHPQTLREFAVDLAEATIVSFTASFFYLTCMYQRLIQ